MIFIILSKMGIMVYWRPSMHMAYKNFAFINFMNLLHRLRIVECWVTF